VIDPVLDFDVAAGRTGHTGADRLLQAVRERAMYEDGVVFFDVSDLSLQTISKFVPYYLHPDAHYVVGVMQMPGRTKISVGSNPWQSQRRTANIATICGRYGGGGKAFDWSLVPRGVPLPVVLSGGLNAANVIDGMRRVRPWAVDVSSGVERAKGIKDAALMRRFCDAVREGDALAADAADQ